MHRGKNTEKETEFFWTSIQSGCLETTAFHCAIQFCVKETEDSENKKTSKNCIFGFVMCCPLIRRIYSTLPACFLIIRSLFRHRSHDRWHAPARLTLSLHETSRDLGTAIDEVPMYGRHRQFFGINALFYG